MIKLRMRELYLNHSNEAPPPFVGFPPLVELSKLLSQRFFIEKHTTHAISIAPVGVWNSKPISQATQNVPDVYWSDDRDCIGVGRCWFHSRARVNTGC